MNMEILSAPTEQDRGNVALLEMNHRWSNALQIVSAGLNPCIQGRVPASLVSGHLRRIQGQILAMAELNRRLSHVPEDQAIEDYCRDLCAALILSFGSDAVMPRLQMCDAPICLVRKQRLGALVVELLTNAIKHGSRGATPGTVWISLSLTDRSTLELMVDDSFTPAANIAPPRPRIVEALVGDLGGELTIRTSPNYASRVRFPMWR